MGGPRSRAAPGLGLFQTLVRDGHNLLQDVARVGARWGPGRRAARGGVWRRGARRGVHGRWGRAGAEEPPAGLEHSRSCRSQPPPPPPPQRHARLDLSRAADQAATLRPTDTPLTAQLNGPGLDWGLPRQSHFSPQSSSSREGYSSSAPFQRTPAPPPHFHLSTSGFLLRAAASAQETSLCFLRGPISEPPTCPGFSE